MLDLIYLKLFAELAVIGVVLSSGLLGYTLGKSKNCTCKTKRK